MSRARDDLKPAIRAEAFRRGFNLCGFASVRPPPHGEFLRRWLADGNAAGMGYMEKGLPRRLQPALVLRGIQSFITLAYPYAPPPPVDMHWKEHLRGRIAAYAGGPDYHDVILAGLDEVAAAVRQMIPGARTLTYVDTGAILEREWADLGGVGWTGKNTMLLHRSEGSWFFLGEILTDVAFEPEPLIADHCGTCRRCLDDCPTGALKGGYVLDARLCISYLTIEHRGPIPIEMRPRLSNWVFGCDVCQEVCPWNGRAESDAEFLQPHLPDLLALDDASFTARFRRTALWRTKRDGLLRNTAVALGNSGNRDAAPFLIRALENDPSPLVRGHAAWALGALGGALARSGLERACRDEDADVRSEARQAVEAVGA